MSFFIDLNESTAVRRRVPFRLFLSNGTAPDTNASNGTMLLSVNGGAQIVSGASISAVSANAGMYYNELSASNVSVLGHIALYTDTLATDFPQHVATVQIVNFNPFSTQSNVTAVGVSGINAGTYSGVSIQGVTRVNSNVTPANALYSALTVRLDPVAYSGATLGIDNIAAGAYSGVTIQGVTRLNSSATIANATYSAVSVQVVGIVPASFTAGALDAAAVSTDFGQEIADRILLRNIDTGDDSGRSVAQALHVLRNRVDASSSVLTVYQTDDTTSSWTASLTTGAAASLQIVDPL